MDNLSVIEFISGIKEKSSKVERVVLALEYVIDEPVSASTK
jgi:hypothetical protein